MFQTLVNKIMEILTANSKIGISYSYMPGILKGNPAAVVVPSSNENEFHTTEENVRIYAFEIILYVKRSSSKTFEDAEDRMRNLVETVVDDLDKDYFLENLQTPAGYTFINWFAAPSAWGYAGETDEYRVATINLQARVSVDLNQID